MSSTSCTRALIRWRHIVFFVYVYLETVICSGGGFSSWPRRVRHLSRVCVCGCRGSPLGCRGFPLAVGVSPLANVAIKFTGVPILKWNHKNCSIEVLENWFFLLFFPLTFPTFFLLKFSIFAFSKFVKTSLVSDFTRLVAIDSVTCLIMYYCLFVVSMQFFHDVGICFTMTSLRCWK